MEDHESSIDRALSKYIHVWLFSIQFAALTGLSFSTIYFQSGELNRWGILGAPVLICVVVSVIATILAWLALSNYLRGFLIPQFIYGDEQDPMIAGRLLDKSMRFLVMAVVARLSASVIDVTFKTLGSF